MFKIRGADGREYGPVSTEQLRQWVREGRAGAQTQVQPAGATTWSPLNMLPEFAETFAAPPSAMAGTPEAMPPVVRTLAFGFFIVAAVSAMWMLYGVFSMRRFLHTDGFHLGSAYYLSWGLSALSILLHIVNGIGLLRGREWARRLAVGFAIVMAVYGAWGISTSLLITFQTVTDSSILLRSPMFLLPYLWSLAVLAFNIGTAVLLSRPVVRAAFVRKAPTTV